MKVYEDEVAVLFDPEASATIELVEITVAPVPSAAVATWNKLLKPTPVEALPLFVIVEVKVRAVFAVAVVGAVIEAVRFGIDNPKLISKFFQSGVCHKLSYTKPEISLLETGVVNVE